MWDVFLHAILHSLAVWEKGVSSYLRLHKSVQNEDLEVGQM